MSVIRTTCALTAAAATLGLSHLEAQTNMPVYTDSPQNGWENWSWASTSNSTRFVHGGTVALAVTVDAWEAAYLHHDAMDTTWFKNIAFWIHGGTNGGQRLRVAGLVGGAEQSSTNLPALTANTWQQFVILLRVLGVDGATGFDGFWVADRTGGSQPTFYLDDITLIGGTPPPPATNAPVPVIVDAQRDRHPISPLIYGVAFATSNQLRELNASLNRSGGNGETRYNWQLNAHNHANDWYYESLADSTNTPGAEADNLVAASKAAGAEAMLTISTVGWVAKLGPNRTRLASYSIAKYGAQTGNDAQWFPDAGNGIRASDNKAITWNDPNDANVPSDVAFQQSWVQHLTNRWGRAAQGGVRWYFADNEPSLWHSTHRDVHPTGASMREVRDKFSSYAAMVKAVDPDTIVAAPEEWGWSGYFHSGLDQQTGATNGWSFYADRATNGGWDYLPWFLDQARQRATNTGQRLLDYFTVHYYPQGGEFGGGTTRAMQERRNRSTRSLWDTNYVDESWIAEKVKLIPRLKNWVAAHYPGTKIGITEYNWGAESHINGATAQADILGIFGREGLDLATRWTTPDSGTPAFNAIKMFRNYDGAKSTFGDASVRANGPNPDELAAFAAQRSSDGALTVMLVHKTAGTNTPVTVSLTNILAASAAQVWQLTSANVITRLPDTPLTNGIYRATLPAQSITLLVVPPQPASRLRANGRRPDGTVNLQLEGTVGQRYRVDQSSDFTNWWPLFTNTLPSGSLPFIVSASNAPRRFYRAVTAP
jgi:hypothetical protein